MRVTDELAEREVLAGRRVLITGGTSGIGEATVLACSAAGARVAYVGRRRARLDALAERVGGVPLVADIRDPEAGAAAVDGAAGTLGGLDALINNAGVARTGSIEHGSVEDWRLMLETNVLGLLAVTKAAIPHLRAARCGDVVNVSSMSGRRVPGATSAVYSGTKHAVHAISTALRRELHDDGVRVTLVSPGFVATEIGDPQPDGRDPRPADDRDGLALPADVIARAVVEALAAPPHVNVLELAILPTAQET
jgi:NADP-dependent 3-hydroxy acid dehydrogenase YdfG